ncbi:hypothetical protein TSOC_009299 [Tetrabaena socialis]|uniref:Apple domain-containing protein n=1 Tax=Tetrabaena socialis TaxID=47790 RepID=A0A2J7ZW93_9CHLO|nr:hypothetical protein TSOC_009299 [Tetrabaena socialis]|eukprot:PNH04522.1 hypothetical protein TSOC_009299 [Tetrabaena socialis]
MFGDHPNGCKQCCWLKTQDGTCSVLANGVSTYTKVCPRPDFWCDPKNAGASNNWVLRQADCDGDGIMDWVCTDVKGNRGVIRSTSGCKSDDPSTGWPAAPTTYCPSLLVCPRPDFWCDPKNAGASNNWVLRQADCDGDGIMDWVCTDVKGNRGVIRSTSGWKSDDPSTGWPAAPTTYCPSLLVCPRPDYWCDPKNTGANWVLDQVDCDGDGIMDLVCTDVKGNRGVIRSTSGCKSDDPSTGWPAAPTSYCPSFPLVCPSVPGYTFNQYMDVPGQDILCDFVGNKTVASLAQSCANTQDCLSFNVFKHDNDPSPKFCLKRAAAPLAVAQATYMKQGCLGIYACPTVPGYTFNQYMDVPGRDIICDFVGDKTVASLAQLCTSTQGCQSFNVFKHDTDPSPKFCLKQAMAPLLLSKVTYMKQACMGIYTVPPHH